MCDQSIINDYESQIAALRFQLDAVMQDRDSWKELSEAQLEHSRMILRRLNEVNAQLDSLLHPADTIADL